MTEDEAKTKWCPFVRAHSEAGSYNRASTKQSEDGVEDWGHNKCVASSCMAWRGVPQVLGRVRVRVKGDGGSTIVSLAAAKKFNWQIIPDDTGYCGLAGAPQ